jgi:hypothetical protein
MNMSPERITHLPVIAISGKAKHGKDTLCQYLSEEFNNYKIIVKRVAFADALKEEAKKFSGWTGVKDEAGRTLLQTLGVKRREENPLYWVLKAYETIKICDSANIVWIITDIRFMNEAFYARDNGGLVIRIHRINEDFTEFDNGLTPEQKKHSSETELDHFNFDTLILNRNPSDLRKFSSIYTEEYFNRCLQ